MLKISCWQEAAAQQASKPPNSTSISDLKSAESPQQPPQQQQPALAGSPVVSGDVAGYTFTNEQTSTNSSTATAAEGKTDKTAPASGQFAKKKNRKEKHQLKLDVAAKKTQPTTTQVNTHKHTHRDTHSLSHTLTHTNTHYYPFVCCHSRCLSTSIYFHAPTNAMHHIAWGWGERCVRVSITELLLALLNYQLKPCFIFSPPTELQQRKEAYTYGGHGQEQHAAFLHPHQVLVAKLNLVCMTCVYMHTLHE